MSHKEDNVINHRKGAEAEKRMAAEEIKKAWRRAGSVLEVYDVEVQAQLCLRQVALPRGAPQKDQLNCTANSFSM